MPREIRVGQCLSRNDGEPVSLEERLRGVPRVRADGFDSRLAALVKQSRNQRAAHTLVLAIFRNGQMAYLHLPIRHHLTHDSTDDAPRGNRHKHDLAPRQLEAFPDVPRKANGTPQHIPQQAVSLREIAVCGLAHLDGGIRIHEANVQHVLAEWNPQNEHVEAAVMTAVTIILLVVVAALVALAILVDRNGLL